MIERVTEAARRFRRAVRECERRGVRVVFGEPPDTDGVTDAPQHAMALHYPSRTVYVGAEVERGRLAAQGLIHEMAHALLGGNPDEHDEVDGPLLAVEYEADRRLKLARGKWMLFYFVGDGEWQGLTTIARGRLLRASREAAIKAGLLDEYGRVR